MGHADTRMVERVYGRLPLETAAPVQQHPWNGKDPAHQPDAPGSDGATYANAENQRAHQTCSLVGPMRELG